MRWSFIAWPLIILMDVVMVINFISYHEETVYEFDQRQSDIVINYAVEAATQEMLSNTGDILLDYINWESIQLDPTAGYNAYLAVVLRSQEWADNELNRNDFEAAHIPFFMVVGYDGYYMYSKQKFEYSYETNGINYIHSGYDMVWTPKIPFATFDSNLYGNEVASTNNQFKAFYLGNDYYLELKPNGDDGLRVESDYKVNIYKVLAGNNQNSYESIITKKKVMISDILTKAVNEALFAGTLGETKNQFFIPPNYETWYDTNPVEEPTVITYLSNSNQHNYMTYSFAVGGAKVTEADYVICYDYQGNKYYTYIENRKQVENLSGINKNKLRILPSGRDAALEGYTFDMRFF